MADNLLESYNPLYDVHLRQYFALPHMQKHLQSLGLLESKLDINAATQDPLRARHRQMMDQMLRNRERVLQQLAELQKKLDAAEKVDLYRRIRSGVTNIEELDRNREAAFHASRSLSRPARSAAKPRRRTTGRPRRHSGNFDANEMIRQVEEDYQSDNTGVFNKNSHNIYNRLAASVYKYQYLHKLDDRTLYNYILSLRKALKKLERFREVTFGPHTMAKHPPENLHESWFFRRRSLPSLNNTTQNSGSAPTTNQNLHRRSRHDSSGRKVPSQRSGKSQSPVQRSRSHARNDEPPSKMSRTTSRPAQRLPPLPNLTITGANKRPQNKEHLAGGTSGTTMRLPMPQPAPRVASKKPAVPKPPTSHKPPTAVSAPTKRPFVSGRKLEQEKKPAKDRSGGTVLPAIAGAAVGAAGASILAHVLSAPEAEEERRMEAEQQELAPEAEEAVHPTEEEEPMDAERLAASSPSLSASQTTEEAGSKAGGDSEWEEGQDAQREKAGSPSEEGGELGEAAEGNGTETRPTPEPFLEDGGAEIGDMGGEEMEPESPVRVRRSVDTEAAPEAMEAEPQTPQATEAVQFEAGDEQVEPEPVNEEEKVDLNEQQQPTEEDFIEMEKEAAATEEPPALPDEDKPEGAEEEEFHRENVVPQEGAAPSEPEPEAMAEERGPEEPMEHDGTYYHDRDDGVVEIAEEPEEAEEQQMTFEEEQKHPEDEEGDQIVPVVNGEIEDNVVEQKEEDEVRELEPEQEELEPSPHEELASEFPAEQRAEEEIEEEGEPPAIELAETDFAREESPRGLGVDEGQLVGEEAQEEEMGHEEERDENEPVQNDHFPGAEEEIVAAPTEDQIVPQSPVYDDKENEAGEEKIPSPVYAHLEESSPGHPEAGEEDAEEAQGIENTEKEELAQEEVERELEQEEQEEEQKPEEIAAEEGAVEEGGQATGEEVADQEEGAEVGEYGRTGRRPTGLEAYEAEEIRRIVHPNLELEHGPTTDSVRSLASSSTNETRMDEPQSAGATEAAPEAVIEPEQQGIEEEKTPLEEQIEQIQQEKEEEQGGYEPEVEPVALSPQQQSPPVSARMEAEEQETLGQQEEEEVPIVPSPPPPEEEKEPEPEVEAQEESASPAIEEQTGAEEEAIPQAIEDDGEGIPVEPEETVGEEPAAEEIHMQSEEAVPEEVEPITEREEQPIEPEETPLVELTSPPESAGRKLILEEEGIAPEREASEAGTPRSAEVRIEVTPSPDHRDEDGYLVEQQEQQNPEPVEEVEPQEESPVSPPPSPEGKDAEDAAVASARSAGTTEGIEAEADSTPLLTATAEEALREEQQEEGDTISRGSGELGASGGDVAAASSPPPPLEEEVQPQNEEVEKEEEADIGAAERSNSGAAIHDGSSEVHHVEEEPAVGNLIDFTTPREEAKEEEAPEENVLRRPSEGTTGGSIQSARIEEADENNRSRGESARDSRQSFHSDDIRLKRSAEGGGLLSHPSIEITPASDYGGGDKVSMDSASMTESMIRDGSEAVGEPQNEEEAIPAGEELPLSESADDIHHNGHGHKASNEDENPSEKKLSEAINGNHHDEVAENGFSAVNGNHHHHHNGNDEHQHENGSIGNGGDSRKNSAGEEALPHQLKKSPEFAGGEKPDTPGGTMQTVYLVPSDDEEEPVELANSGVANHNHAHEQEI